MVCISFVSILILLSQVPPKPKTDFGDALGKHFSLVGLGHETWPAPELLALLEKGVKGTLSFSVPFFLQVSMIEGKFTYIDIGKFYKPRSSVAYALEDEDPFDCGSFGEFAKALAVVSGLFFLHLKRNVYLD